MARRRYVTPARLEAVDVSIERLLRCEGVPDDLRLRLRNVQAEVGEFLNDRYVWTETLRGGRYLRRSEP